MSQDKIDILKRALWREKAARKVAEKILEEKSISLYNNSKKLERVNAELQSLLSKTDSQLQGVFETIVDAYVIMDLEFNILKMNKAAMRMLGFDSDKVDFNLGTMVMPYDTQRVANSFKELMKNGVLTDFEIEIKTNDNKIITTQINASIIYDSNIAVAAQGIIRDVTEQKENAIVSSVINDVAQSILGKDKIYDIAVEITEKLSSYLKTNDCVIYVVNHLERTVEQIAAAGKKLDVLGNINNRLEFGFDTGIVGEVAKSGKALLIDDTSKDSRYLTDIDTNLSELTVPIIIDGEVVAIIDAEHPERNYFTKVHLTTIENIAQIIALKIKNAINFRKREESQKKLLKSEERLRTLIASFESGILLEDENRKIVLTNAKFCEMFSIPVTPEQMIGADCSEAAQQSKHYFKNPEAFVNRIELILKEKVPVLADELEMVNGMFYERDFIPLFTNGSYSGHLWNYKNVTLQKKYKSSLELQKQKYGNIIANMNLGLIEVDNDDKILMINQSFSKMSGYTEAELLGKKGSDIFLDEKGAKKLQLQSKRRLVGVSNSYEIEIKNKFGEKRIWLVSGAPNYNLNGMVVGSIGIHLDITKHITLQQEKDKLVELLKNKNDELQEYAHIVSHDLKSPLRNLNALTTWLKDDNISILNKSSLMHFEQIEHTLERMEGLITGVLKYSSISNDMGVLPLVDVNSVITDVIKTLYVPEHIKIKIQNQLPSLYGDKIKFQQLFQNLLHNAITHIDKPEGYIEIGYTLKNKMHTFYVKDNGVGVEKKYHDKLFKMFYHITNTKHSTGIGLSIVKKIVEIYGGTIWVSSKLGHGTTFYFTLKNSNNETA